MKTVHQYKCEVCGTLYTDKEECVQCEKQHVFPLEVTTAHHRPRKVCAKYPPRIDIKFSDGTIQRYEHHG